MIWSPRLAVRLVRLSSSDPTRTRPVVSGVVRRKSGGSVGRSEDEFIRGVLCTLSAWVIMEGSFVARVRAGAEVATFPSACNCVIQKV